MTITSSMIIEDRIFSYIAEEITDDVRITENLEDIFRRSPIGFQGAALDFAGFVEREYGIPLEEIIKHDPSKYTVSEAAEFLCEQLEARRK